MMLSLVYDHLWQSTVFAAAAGLFSAALRQNRARVRHGLWLAASIKFLIALAVLIELGGRIPLNRVPPSGFSAEVGARTPQCMVVRCVVYIRVTATTARAAHHR